MKKTLEIKNLHVQTKEGKKIINGLSLTINKGEIHALMGPNGSGKSTLAQALMGHPSYITTKGKILLDGKDITALSPDKKALLGLFLAFQYPIEVPGVNFASFLRMAINEKSSKRISPLAFNNELTEKAEELSVYSDITQRSLNEGFSGGEKKKAEILQLSILKPDFAILDEPDSGLDVDALKHIAKVLNNLQFPIGILLITHYQRILHFVKPQKIHIMVKGQIIKSADADLAQEIEKEGYSKFLKSL